jgi:hypothetical protein
MIFIHIVKRIVYLNYAIMPTITFDKVYNALKNKRYKIFEQDTKPYNLNIIGIRSDNRKPDSFDDWIAVMWKYKGNWSFQLYEATTDPGLFWLKNPMNPKGTAIVKEGQYAGSHKMGKHNNEYKALQQIGNITVIRDYNRDGTLDINTGREETGNDFCINIHRARLNGKSIIVDKWSAGCQVFADSFQFDQFIKMCEQAVTYWGNSFTYTLITEYDL